MIACAGCRTEARSLGVMSDKPMQIGPLKPGEYDEQDKHKISPDHKNRQAVMHANLHFDLQLYGIGGQSTTLGRPEDCTRSSGRHRLRR